MRLEGADLMHTTHVVGVDPGLVHTGVVRFVFVPEKRELHLQHHAIQGPRGYATWAWITHSAGMGMGVLPKPHIFIEAYRPRSHYSSDERMVKGVAEIKAETKGTVVNNTGSKRVVKRELMELLGVWKFTTPTHHQDLRAAARIALFGMLKDEWLNSVLTTVVRDHLHGRTWDVYQ